MENQNLQDIQISGKTVEMLAIGMIKPYSKNPRVHNAKQIEKIKNSIMQFGFTAPILVDKENNIISICFHFRTANSYYPNPR